MTSTLSTGSNLAAALWQGAQQQGSGCPNNPASYITTNSNMSDGFPLAQLKELDNGIGNNAQKRKADSTSFGQPQSQKLKNMDHVVSSAPSSISSTCSSPRTFDQNQQQQNDTNKNKMVLQSISVAPTMFMGQHQQQQDPTTSNNNGMAPFGLNSNNLQQQQQYGDVSWVTPMFGNNNSANMQLQSSCQPQMMGQHPQQPISANGKGLRAFLNNPNLPSPITNSACSAAIKPLIGTNSTPSFNSSEPSCVHRCCQLFPTNEGIIKGAVELDPAALRRKTPVDSTGGNPILEKYGYPLNIAIRQDASLDVLKLLVKGAPDVISYPDGRDESGSLGIVLRRKPNDLHILHLLIIANPDCLRMKDRRLNYPLHVAVASGASIDIIKPLYLLYPDAIREKNINGETPFDISRRTAAICSDSVVNFLQSAYNEELRRRRTRRGGVRGSR